MPAYTKAPARRHTLPNAKRKGATMSTPSIAGSGDGTRPTTSGGADNIGAGEKFTSRKNAAGEDISGPAPQERMQAKRKNVEASRHDDSADFNLREDLTPVSNKEDPESGEALGHS
jgi:hypothetical protein